jgi:hypothetical protein
MDDYPEKSVYHKAHEEHEEHKGKQLKGRCELLLIFWNGLGIIINYS